MTITGTEVGIETSRPPSLILESVRNKQCHGTANKTNPVSIYNLLRFENHTEWNSNDELYVPNVAGEGFRIIQLEEMDPSCTTDTVIIA